MRGPNLLVVLFSLSSIASAHFKLINPTPRGFDEDTLGEYPCGGQDFVSEKRTKFPINGAPVQLFLEHTITTFAVILALGNNPSGADFTHIVVPTFQELGPRDFCIRNVDIAAALGNEAKAGMNATMLVTSSGDSGAGSGLYNCADITLVSGAATQSFDAQCNDSPGVRVQSGGSQQNLNPNGTAIGGGSGSSGGGSGDSGSSDDPNDAGFVTRANTVGAVFATVVVAAFCYFSWGGGPEDQPLL